MKKSYKIILVVVGLVLVSSIWFAVKKNASKNPSAEIKSNQATVGNGWISKSLKGVLATLGNGSNQNSESANLSGETQNNSQNDPLAADNPSSAGQTALQAPFSFAVIGDTKSFDNIPAGPLAQAVKSISEKKTDLVMTVGDLVQDCSKFDQCKSSFDQWKSVMQPILPKTYEVVGNHDRHGGGTSDKAWQESFDLPANGPVGFSELTYSFDYNNSHFVVLDTEKPKPHALGPDQLAWIKNDLDNNKKQNVFVFFHEPAFPVGSKIGSALDVTKNDRDALWNILDSHKVTAVFSGHEHIFSLKTIDKKVFPEAKNNIRQFVVGNTAAPEEAGPASGMADYSFASRHFAIVKVNQEKITLELYDTGGKLVKSWDFSGQ